MVMAPTPPDQGETGMRIDHGHIRPAAPSIVVLTSVQPILHRLASTATRGGLTADRVVLLRQRVGSGYYDSRMVADVLARCLHSAREA
jgi:hypothetical protein